MSDPFLGEIRMVGFNFAPVGWANCDGGLLNISSFSALFSLFGTTYGGNGSSNFNVPDLRGRVPIHTGAGPGLTNRPWGQKSGAETVSLTTDEMPSHDHAVLITPNLTANAPVSSQVGNQTNPTGNVPAVANDGESNYRDSTDGNNSLPVGGSLTADVSDTGSSQAHNNMPPYLTIRFIVALTGLYPSPS